MHMTTVTQIEHFRIALFLARDAYHGLKTGPRTRDVYGRVELRLAELHAATAVLIVQSDVVKLGSVLDCYRANADVEGFIDFCELVHYAVEYVE